MLAFINTFSVEAFIFVEESKVLKILLSTRFCGRIQSAQDFIWAQEFIYQKFIKTKFLWPVWLDWQVSGNLKILAQMKVVLAECNFACI